MNCCSVFPYDFFQNYLCRVLFLNIELVKNYNYNKAKSYEESVVVFLTKHCGLLQRFFLWVFFLPKLSMLVFFFNIKLVENLAL
jgi:hypothetical protein